MKIPFHKPILPDNFDSILTDSIKDGWLTTGPQVKEFESQLSGYLGVENVIAVNSCTAALHLALVAKGFGRGDKFLVPTYTFVSTVECGEYLGMEPILIDCEKGGFSIDFNQVEDILKKERDVKAIVPVHFAGKPVDMKKVFELADRYGLFVLEDAAHALESVSNLGKVGQTNHGVAFSFYANKNITTGGEGGALATNDLNLANKVRKLSLHGISRDGWKRHNAGGKWEYDVSELGFKYNLTDMAASFGLWQLTQLEEWQKRRLEIVKQYLVGLDHIAGLVLPEISAGHAWHLFVIQIMPDHWKISRNELVEKINERGIGVAVHYKPVHMLSYYQRQYGFKLDQYPQAKSLFETVISLPLYPGLQNIEVDYIIESISDLRQKYII